MKITKNKISRAVNKYFSHPKIKKLLPIFFQARCLYQLASYLEKSQIDKTYSLNFQKYSKKVIAFNQYFQFDL